MTKDSRYLRAYAAILEHGWDRGFAQQSLADAYNAEFATTESKPITLAFALVGLCLKIEQNFDGRQVQAAHGRLARHKSSLPRLSPDRGRIDFDFDQFCQAPSMSALDRWCVAVWEAFSVQHVVVRELADRIED